MNRARARKIIMVSVTAIAALVFAGQVHATQYIAKDGEAMAEIVTAEDACRAVELAATELQTYIRKISGATLPIKSADEEAEMPVRIYVGRSRHTDRLGVDAADLEWGAYRMRSGDGWLVLIGDDQEFAPQGVRGDARHEWMQHANEEWEKATAETGWQPPIKNVYKMRYNEELDLWRYDRKGSMNAVYAFLRDLGVRWYMRGELGEIVPKQSSVAVPSVDRIVRPDYPLRIVAYARYGLRHALEEIMWSMRIGVNDAYGYQHHHGLARVTGSKILRAENPDYMALYNGERQVLERTANACLSSKGLFEETLRFVRLAFDIYDLPVVSVQPADGFTTMCQCENCRGKNTPERGSEGLLSDYVWDFVNRVAIEIEKTHPGKLISCGAYSTYRLPPEKIEKLNSNVLAFIVNGRRRYPQENMDVAMIREWARLTDGKVITFMNVGGGANTPRMFAEEIRALKGLAMGEDMWPPFDRGGLAQPGFNHLNYYITARFEWDAEQDIDAVLDEYYRLYYGPAGEAMAEFIDYYEQHQYNMRYLDSAPVIERALDLFAAAKAKADPESVYGQRLALFEEGLARHRRWYNKIKAGRVDVPVYTLEARPAELAAIEIDGKLDEAFWGELPGRLKDVETGGDPRYPTRFRLGVHEGALYVGIRCQDEPGEPLNAVELRKDTHAIYEGDLVEIILETPKHSYYQIDVNPMGSTADLNRGAFKSDWFRWDALADIAVDVNQEEGVWTVEARIPFTPSEQDPFHEVVGPPPSPETPWYFNICRVRQRDRGEDKEATAYSPTEARSFHKILKFAKLK